MVKRVNRRNEILDAAETLVLENGVHALTIDNIALLTGLGKGGVLYHFKYKADLFQGLIDRYCERWDTLLREGSQEAGGDVQAWLNFLVKFALEDNAEEQRGGIAIIAAAAAYPKLLEPIRVMYERRQRLILSKIKDPELAAIIVLALDGFTFFKSIALAPIDDELKDGVQNKMHDLISNLKENND